MADRDRAITTAEARLITRVCWAYYREGLTQEQIAERLGMPRKRVIQTLAQGRSSGIVQISVSAQEGLELQLEQALCEAHGLESATVIPAPLAGADIRQHVGAALADVLSATLRNGDRIGLTWGGTMHAATCNLRAGTLRDLTVVQLLGGLSRRTRFNPFDNVSRFATALNADCLYLPAPMLADTLEQRATFMQSPQIRDVLGQAETLDVAVLTAIDLTEQSGGLEYGVLSRADWQSLRDIGAVGDICGHYLGADGTVLDHDIPRRTVHAGFETLRKARRRILAAGGTHKAGIIRAALKSGIVTTLVTDEETAKGLL